MCNFGRRKKGKGQSHSKGCSKRILQNCPPVNEGNDEDDDDASVDEAFFSDRKELQHMARPFPLIILFTNEK